MRHIPTDLEILNSIYKQYYNDFAAFSDEEKSRSSKIHMPIDITSIAKDMNVDPDIIFGRLYYHLDKKFSYKMSDGSHVNFFLMRVGKDRHCVNFPLVASVLSDLRTEDRKFRTATSIAAVSLIISVVSIVLTILN